MKGVCFRAETCFMSWWEKFLTRYASSYIITTYGDGGVRVHEMCNFLGLWPVEADSASMAFTNEQDALSWVEKELRAREVKSRTYAVEYED